MASDTSKTTPLRVRADERGRRFRPVLLALYAWSDARRLTGGRNLVLVDWATGREVDPVQLDRATGLSRLGGSGFRPLLTKSF